MGRTSVRALALAMLAVSAQAFVMPSASFGASIGRVALRSGTTSALTGLQMAGFGKADDSKGKKSSQAKTRLMGIPKKLLNDYGVLTKAGSKSVKVFAGIPGEGKWYESGSIASKGDKTAEACQIEKRLILEYAADYYPVLKSKKASLVVGYSQSGDSEDDVVELVKPASVDDVEHGFLPKMKTTATTGLNRMMIDSEILH